MYIAFHKFQETDFLKITSLMQCNYELLLAVPCRGNLVQLKQKSAKVRAFTEAHAPLYNNTDRSYVMKFYFPHFLIR